MLRIKDLIKGKSKAIKCLAFYVNYFLVVPGLSLYPAVKIAAKNATDTAKIKISFMYIGPPYYVKAFMTFSYYSLSFILCE